MDDDGNRSIDMREFTKGIHDFGLMMEKDELQELYAHFDQDGSGTIDFDEFLKNLRVSLRSSSSLLMSLRSACSYTDGVTKPMACFQYGSWFCSIELILYGWASSHLVQSQMRYQLSNCLMSTHAVKDQFNRHGCYKGVTVNIFLTFCSSSKLLLETRLSNQYSR